MWLWLHLAGLKMHLVVWQGFKYQNSTFVGPLFHDYNTNALREFNHASHEVTLKFYLGRGGKNSNAKNDKK